MKFLCVVILLFCFSNSCKSESIQNESEYVIKTADAQSTLRLYIRRPTTQITGKEKLPVVIVIPGTDATSDLYFNPLFPNFEQTEDGMLGLGDFLVSNNIILVRYDTRGIIAGRKCMGHIKRALSFSEYVNLCWENDQRISVDFATLRSDIESVYNFVLLQEGIDPERVCVLAYSEGFVHAANVIGNRRISAKGIVTIGGPAESPYQVLSKQITQFLPKLLESEVQNTQKPVSLDFLVSLAQKKYWLGQKLQSLFPDKAFISYQDIAPATQKIKNDFEKDLTIYRSAPRDATFVERRNNIKRIASSMGYLKDKFIEKSAFVEPLDDLSNFPGDIYFYYGELDQRLELVSNIQIIERKKKNNPRLDYQILANTGHGLEESGSEIMSLKNKQNILRKILDILK